LWHNFLITIQRLNRYSLGLKIDNIFTDILEVTLTAQYMRHDQKRVFLQELSRKLDTLKFFITLLWEAKGLDTNKYSQLSQKLGTAGRMLGKWIISFKDAP